MVATVLADGRVGESILRTGAPQRVLLKGFLDGLAQRRTGPRELREPGRRGIVPVNPNRHNRPNFGAVSQPIDNYREARYLSPDGHLSGGGRRSVSKAYRQQFWNLARLGDAEGLRRRVVFPGRAWWVKRMLENIIHGSSRALGDLLGQCRGKAPP